jgi:heme A synthase
MYTIVLLIHSWVRWIALVCGFGATMAALMGRTGDAASKESAADRWGMFLILALDLQMLLGLVLYLGLSPNMKEILANFGEAMKNPATRFWAVEHITAMFAAVIVAHVGRVLARKAKTPASKRSRLLVCFALSTILMLAGMPWPGRPGGRVLFRL